MKNRPVFWGAHPLAQWAERATDAELEAALKDHRAIECEREIFRRERDWREVDREYGRNAEGDA